MPNVPRRDKAEAGKYAKKMFLDYVEACDYLGLKRATLYNHMKALNIEGIKFDLERKRFLTMEDVKTIERVIEEPWLVNELRKKPRKSSKEVA